MKSNINQGLFLKMRSWKPDLPKHEKQIVMRLRWPLIIASSCLMIFAPNLLLPKSVLYRFALFHVLSNALLSFVDEIRFKSILFFSALVLFDTLALSFSLLITGQLASDLYLTYFLIIITAAFWRDFRYSLAFAVVISLFYGCLLLVVEGLQTETMLRIPFLFMASVFYGYFAQIAANEQELRKIVERESRRDFLTSLPNRRAFEERIAEELARAVRYERPLSLLILDIDNFKIVNDSLGHQWGDIVLRNVAEILGDRKRPSDFAARVGGEEFALILSETALDAAVDAGSRLCREIGEHPVETPKGAVSVTVSIGASSHTGNFPDAEQLYAEADKALHLAKAGGKNRVEILGGTASVRPAVISRVPLSYETN